MGNVAISKGIHARNKNTIGVRVGERMSRGSAGPNQGSRSCGTACP